MANVTQSTFSASALNGRVFGNYRITQALGRGGMGLVMLAENPRLDRQAAIKILDPDRYTRRQMSRFVNEAKAMASIRHANVAEVYDSGETDDGLVYYVMEYLAGGTLKDYLAANARLSLPKTLSILKQICEGLSAAHQRGIVHRDLKPENIIFKHGDAETLKIVDFGIAKLLEVTTSDSLATKEGMVMGSPAVLAPEQASAKPDKIGPWTDIYALGVLGYWMLAGNPPFASDDIAIMLYSHAAVEPPSLAEQRPGLPAQVCELIHRCLAKKPADRPSSSMALLELLEQLPTEERHDVAALPPQTIVDVPAQNPLPTSTLVKGTPAQPSFDSASLDAPAKRSTTRTAVIALISLLAIAAAAYAAMRKERPAQDTTPPAAVNTPAPDSGVAPDAAPPPTPDLGVPDTTPDHAVKPVAKKPRKPRIRKKKRRKRKPRTKTKTPGKQIPRDTDDLLD